MIDFHFQTSEKAFFPLILFSNSFPLTCSVLDSAGGQGCAEELGLCKANKLLCGPCSAGQL